MVHSPVIEGVCLALTHQHTCTTTKSCLVVMASLKSVMYGTAYLTHPINEYVVEYNIHMYVVEYNIHISLAIQLQTAYTSP